MTLFYREKCNYTLIMYASVKTINFVPAYALKLKLISKFAQLAGCTLPIIMIYPNDIL